MRHMILIATLSLGCSSRAYSAGYTELEGGAAGAGCLLEVDADVADRIFDAYAPADVTDETTDSSSSGDSSLPPNGQCPVLLDFPCEPASCSGTCACNDYARWECVAASSGAYCECS